MSRYIKKIVEKTKDKLNEKVKERQEWKIVKAKIQKEERIKHEKLLEKQKLAHERKKAKERLEKGHPLKRIAISGLKLTGEVLKESLSDPEKPKKKKSKK